MENKVYYKIEIYKGLFNHDVGFDGMEEPVALKIDVDNDDDDSSVSEEEKGDDNIAWGKNKIDANKESHSRMINAWQTAIDNYKENLNTILESINSDIDVWRSKMNTWDGLANKIRHRDYEIRQNLMSRALR